MALQHPEVDGSGPRAASSLRDQLDNQARRTPSAIAVHSSASSLTYEALRLQSDGLAAALYARGARPGSTVALLSARTPAMIVGLQAILKSGATYLPLDPAYPPDRTGYILEDSGTSLVLADHASAPLLPRSGPETVLLDALAPGPAPNIRALPVPDVDEVAYLIYTSGSTGRPKGVEVTHRNLLNYLRSMIDTLGFGAGDVVAGVSTIAFDIAAFELWLPLIVGARVALFTREEAQDGRLLGRLYRERGVTIAQGTPATWRLLLESDWGGNPRLTVLCGGEEMTRELAARLLPRCRALWNMYGPTETTVCSLAHRVESGTGPVPIGRPLLNTTIEVRGADGTPVGPGGEGELYIGGMGVARGYRNRPDLTAERFVTTHGDRLYRTGDLVRVLADGSLVFAGRLDQQLKIRGFRIEAGEVESALLADPGVAQAVVVAAPEGEGRSVLAAHLVTRAGATIDRAALREGLRRTLPEYMIPTRIAVHAALPRTPSGKFDRQALARLSADAGVPGLAAYVAPRSDAERRLARIWEEALQVRPIGVTADFFDLGGHSLLAAVVFAEISRQFGVELPIASLVDTPTIEGLAARLTSPVEDAWRPVVPIRTTGDEPPLFFVHGGGGTVLFLRDIVAGLPPGRPVYGLQSEGQDGRRMSGWRVEWMAARYLRAIRRVQPRGPYCLAGYCFGALVAFEMARQLQAAHEEPGLVVLVAPPHTSNVLGVGLAPDAATRRPVSERALSLLRRGWARWPRAIASGIAWRWREVAVRRPITHAAARAGHALLALGGRVPRSWRPAYVNAMTDHSALAYRPAWFDGTLHLIRGAGQPGPPDLGWGELAARLVIHRVTRPNQLRRELVQPPLVAEVAGILGQVLATDRSASAGAPLSRDARTAEPAEPPGAALLRQPARPACLP